MERTRSHTPSASRGTLPSPGKTPTTLVRFPSPFETRKRLASAATAGSSYIVHCAIPASRLSDSAACPPYLQQRHDSSGESTSQTQLLSQQPVCVVHVDNRRLVLWLPATDFAHGKISARPPLLLIHPEVLPELGVDPRIPQCVRAYGPHSAAEGRQTGCA